MSSFKYKAIDPSGKKSKGFIGASSKAEAIQKLKKEKLYPTEIVFAKTKNDSSPKSLLKRDLFDSHRVSKRELTATTRQLSTLLRANLPLDKSLDAIIESSEADSGLQKIMSEVREMVREGSTLSEAFSKKGKIFDSAFTTMVKAGENSGALDVVMERLAEYMEQQEALKRKVQSALAYPFLMLVVGISVVVFLLIFVVPNVVQIFFDMGRALPVPTQILISTSQFVSQHWLSLLLVFIGISVVFLRLKSTSKGKQFLDRFLISAPFISSLIKEANVNRFSKTLGLLLKNGVPLVNALNILEGLSKNTIIKKTINSMRESVEEGQSLILPIKDQVLFSSTDIQMISSGEQSGQIDEMLLLIADESEMKLNTKLQFVTSLLEPLMILFLGLVVGFVVLAIMLPIFEMSSLVGG